MKPEEIGYYIGGDRVTPRAGVWIETFPRNTGTCAGIVTPRAGVWIETR